MAVEPPARRTRAALDRGYPRPAAHMLHLIHIPPLGRHQGRGAKTIGPGRSVCNCRSTGTPYSHEPAPARAGPYTAVLHRFEGRETHGRVTRRGARTAKGGARGAGSRPNVRTRTRSYADDPVGLREPGPGRSRQPAGQTTVMAAGTGPDRAHGDPHPRTGADDRACPQPELTDRQFFLRCSSSQSGCSWRAQRRVTQPVRIPCRDSGSFIAIRMCPSTSTPMASASQSWM